MLDVRSPLVLAAGPVGLLLACAGWLALAGPQRVLDPIDAAEARLAAAPIVRLAAPAPAAQGVIAAPFAPAKDVAIRLDGLSRTPRRTAALLSIGGAEAEWIAVGATVSGVTVIQVTPSGAVVDTRAGRRQIELGETVGAASGTAAAGESPPAGTRLPPEPADAPGGM